MKKKVSKELIALLILVLVVLWIAFFISSRMDNKLPKYSVSNKAANGYSVFYEALKELDYPVGKTVKPINEHKNMDMQIVVQNDNFDINNNEIKKWVEEGGNIIYLATKDFYPTEYDVIPQEKGKISIYKYHEGSILVSDPENITNITLTEDTENAYNLLSEISNYSFEKIYFNETYIFVNTNKKSLWDYIPIELKYILYQMILAIAAFYYYKGKRFGKTIPLHEEVERTENEYLYSAASLYKQAKCWDIMMENYYKNFLKNLNCSEENWLSYWKKEDLPHLNKAKRVYKLLEENNKNYSEKKYIEIIKNLEELNNVLKKRREIHWKTLKRTL
jgi:hypothetical protein